MYNVNEKIVALENKISDLERKKKEEKKALRDEQKRQAQLRNFAVGEMVVKLFPELEKIPLGKKAENAERFGWFENFLKDVLDDPMWEQQYRKCVPRDSTKYDDA